MKSIVIGKKGTVALLIGVAMIALTPGRYEARAVEQGTITATATETSGQFSIEDAEICFVVTADEAGIDVLDRKCTSGESNLVTFGPTSPDLQTGITYFVWEFAELPWRAIGANPMAIIIPDSTGEAFATFENSRLDGAYVLVYESVCPPGFKTEDSSEYREICSADPRVDVAMSASGPGDSFHQDTTDLHGIAGFGGYTEAGQVTVAEGVPSGDYSAFVVVCNRVDTGDSIPVEYRSDGRAAFAIQLAPELVTGDVGIVCDWFNIPPASIEETASLTIHKSACTADVPNEDRFERCHEIGVTGIAFTLQGPVDGDGITQGRLGSIHWGDLPAGLYTLAESAPSGDFVDYAVLCTRFDNDDDVLFERGGNGRAAIQIELGIGALVVCDWYNLAPADWVAPTPPSDLTLSISPDQGEDGEIITFRGAGYTPGGAVVILMTGDGLIVFETTADLGGVVSGSFVAPERNRLTGESSNEIPVFAIDQESGRESNKVTFTYLVPPE